MYFEATSVFPSTAEASFCVAIQRVFDMQLITEVAVLIKYFWIGTISESYWIYTHDDWEVVQEKTLQIDLYTDKDYYEFVDTLKAIFNQESIMVLIQEKPKVEFL